MSKTILVAGFQHETNTFGPTKADYASFARGEGHPALPRGDEIFQLVDVNLPIGGFLLAAAQKRHFVRPVVWAGASPSAHVTTDAFERIAGEIVAAASQGNFDAIYLDLHGAMVTESCDDGEGELLARLRAVVGDAVPIVASLDLHANVTAKMLSTADGLVAYRTYPHVDMAETGVKALALLEKLLSVHRPLSQTARRLPFLIPINGMCTLLEPAKSTYARLADLEANGIVSLSFTPGFPAADFPECGPVIWGYGEDEEAVSAAINELYDLVVDNEAAWQVPFLSPDEAVKESMRLSAYATGPVVIADTQDNPGAGADANTVGMLRALVENGAQKAAVGLFWDPRTAQAAHHVGVGATLELTLGGRSGIADDIPFTANFEVVALSDGQCVYDGPMMHGMKASLGPCACLKVAGVYVIVSSTKAQMFDRNLYRMAGIEPEQMKILVNKSSVHFRADFEPIAHAILIAKAPGPMLADPADLPWKRLAPGLRTAPGGRAFMPASDG